MANATTYLKLIYLIIIFFFFKLKKVKLSDKSKKTGATSADVALMKRRFSVWRPRCIHRCKSTAIRGQRAPSNDKSLFLLSNNVVGGNWYPPTTLLAPLDDIPSWRNHQRLVINHFYFKWISQHRFQVELTTAMRRRCQFSCASTNDRKQQQSEGNSGGAAAQYRSAAPEVFFNCGLYPQ